MASEILPTAFAMGRAPVACINANGAAAFVDDAVDREA